MKFSVIASLLLSAMLTLTYYQMLPGIVNTFLQDPDAYNLALNFSQILLSTSVLFGVFYVPTNALQAVGAATAALIINLSRQGIIYIPALFILQSVLGMNGLVWAQPAADILSTLLVIFLYIKVPGKICQKSPAIVSNAF